MKPVQSRVNVFVAMMLVYLSVVSGYWGVYKPYQHEQEIEAKNAEVLENKQIAQSAIKASSSEVLELSKQLEEKDDVVTDLLEDNRQISAQLKYKNSEISQKDQIIEKQRDALVGQNSVLRIQTSEFKTVVASYATHTKTLIEKLKNVLVAKNVAITERDLLALDNESLLSTNSSLMNKNSYLTAKVNSTKTDANPAFKVTAASHPAKDTYADGDSLLVLSTAYTATCKGCIGITKTGVDVRNVTPNIIAVDPSIIPLNSKVELKVGGKSLGVFTASDIGGDIKGHRIDILMANNTLANNWGRRIVEVKILNRG